VNSFLTIYITRGPEMAKTLARQIRRIGMLPTTYKDVVIGHRTVSELDEDGKKISERQEPIIKRYRTFHFDEDILKNKRQIINDLTIAWRRSRTIRTKREATHV
jgi:hypothetical protein